MSKKLIIEYQLNDKGVLEKTRLLNKEVAGTEEAGKKASKGLKLAAGAAAAFVSAITISRLVDFGKKVIDVGSRFETLHVQMKAVTGSSEAADKAMAWIKDFTLNTPYQLEQVSGAFVKLKSMGLDPMGGTMQAVADSASKLGGSMEVMDTITLALGKANAKTKLSMEEMNMMMERGVPVLDILADRMGMTTAEIVKMSSQGQLGRDAIQQLIIGMQEWAGPASISLMDTFAGKWSNLQDHITNALNEMAEAGMLDAAKEVLTGLIDVIKRAVDSGILTEFGKMIADGMRSAAPVIEGVAKAMVGLARVSLNLRTAWRGLKAEATHLQIKELKDKLHEMRLELGVGVQMTEAQLRKYNAMQRALRDLEGVYQDQIGLLGESEAAMREIIDALDGIESAADDTASSLSGGGGVRGGLAGAYEEVGEVAKESFLSAGDQFIDILGPDGRVHRMGWDTAFKGKFEEMPEWAKDAAVESGEKMTTEFAKTSNIMESTFSDLLGKGFMGELETFSDLWDSVWQDLAKSMAGKIGDAFQGMFSGKGEGSFVQILQDSGVGGLGGALGGLGTMIAGTQSQGDSMQRMIMGGLGGALGGFALGGSLMAAGGLFGAGLGPAGAIAGAIIGAAVSYFMGGADAPSSAGWIGPGGGQVTGTSGQGLPTGAREVFTTERVQEYRASIRAMNDVMRLFGDGELFDLIGEAPTWNFSGQGSLNDLATVFREQWLPDAMREMFEAAINQGLGDLGVTDATIDQLWSELSGMSGVNQIAGLETYINSLVGLTTLFDDMNWDTIMDESRMDSFTSFMAGMSDIADAVQLQMVGIDDMSLLERAEQAQTIEGLIFSARQAEIAMLRQLDAMQQSINRSLSQQIEGIELGGMSDAKKKLYYKKQIESIMSTLRAGGVTPDQLATLMADLQRYTAGYQSVYGEDFYRNFTGAGGAYQFNPSEWILSILNEAGGLSDDLFGGFRTDVQDQNAILLDQLGVMLNALTDFTGVFAGEESIFTPEITIPVEVKVNIEGDKSLFVREVRAIIHAELNRKSSMPGLSAPHGVM